MQPHLFPVFVWERLSWLGMWLDGTTTVPGHGTLVGAITFAFVGAAATIAFMKRRELAPVIAWAVTHPIVTTLLAMPVVAFVLLCLTKYLTFASAMATTIGVLVALSNNNRTHDKDEKRFDRQAKAARAALGLDLSAVASHCEAIIIQIDKIPPLTTEVAAKFVVDDIKFPTVPASVTATIKENMVSTRYEAVADRCGLVLGHLQLVHANLETLFDENMFVGQVDIESKKIRVALLYALASSLFDYARHGIHELPAIDWPFVQASAGHIGLDTSIEFVEYMEQSIKQHPKGPLSIYEIA